MNNVYFSLSDDVIVHIVKIIQLGLITGTDVVDHLRMIKVEANDNDELRPTSEYTRYFDDVIEKLLSDAVSQTPQTHEGEDSNNPTMNPWCHVDGDVDA